MPQEIAIPLQEVDGFTFNVGCIIAIDRTRYSAEAQDRQITLYLIGEIDHTFEGPGADQFNFWYLQATGQAHIMPVP